MCDGIRMCGAAQVLSLVVVEPSDRRWNLNGSRICKTVFCMRYPRMGDSIEIKPFFWACRLTVRAHS